MPLAIGLRMSASFFGVSVYVVVPLNSVATNCVTELQRGLPTCLCEFPLGSTSFAPIDAVLISTVLRMLVPLPP